MSTRPTRGRQLALADAEREAVRRVHQGRRAAAQKLPTLVIPSGWPAAVGRAGGWEPQAATRHGWEHCPHRAAVVAQEPTRRTRTRIEYCESCGAWRFAPIPPPRGPWFGQRIDGPFCLIEDRPA